MRHAIILATTMLAITAPFARADFVLKGTTPPQPHGVPAAPTPEHNAHSTPDTTLPLPPSPPKAQWKMAYGFGDAVPLGFACRQIVPAGVRVTYGPGANSAMLVSWMGGDTWNHVLRDAVRPLGLHLVMIHMAVEIAR